MTALRLLVDLLLIAPRLALAWLKTKLPSRKVSYRRCCDCGWSCWWDGASPICPPCQKEWRHKVPVSKLFCCDVDLEYLGSRPGGSAIDYRYRCPACGRIWLYIVEWHKDSGSDAGWYPQWTEAECATGSPPNLYDERTRTKVYH